MPAFGVYDNCTLPCTDILEGHSRPLGKVQINVSPGLRCSKLPLTPMTLRLSVGKQSNLW